MTVLNKVCELGDFAEGPTRETIREVFAHEVDRFGPGFPERVAYRKHWEVAMAIRALREGLPADRPARVLGVGAGNEPTLFWLTQHATVHATDLYLDPSGWTESANASMLTEPGGHWPGPWSRQRLVVQHMDARDLHYEDESFDAVFSSSSLEHFGTDVEIGRALDEMCRVLRPGGICSLSTELRFAGDRTGLPDIRIFSEAELLDLVLEAARPWALTSTFDGRVSAATRRAAVPFEEAAADVRAHVARYGTVRFHALEFSTYPHVALSVDELVWTSVHLALVKAR